MPLTSTDLEALLAPLAGDAPCGAALDFDPRFQALQTAATGKPERQWGDRIYAAEEPDWPVVDEQALALAAVTRDLRVAVLLLRSGTRLQGYGAAATGLRLIQQLLQRHWDRVHPELDHEDGDDPTMRLSALAPLFTREVLPTELRAAALAPERGSLRLRDLELGLGRADADPGETVPTEAGTLEALTGLLQRHPQIADEAQAAFEAAQAIVAELEGRLGAAQVPTAAPLLDLLRVPVDAIARLRAPAGAAAVCANAAGAATPVATTPVAIGAINSRDDAIRELDRVSHWIERNEPGHPAPLLIRRAARLMNKSFVELVRDLAPNGLDQVAVIAGIDANH